MMPTRHPPLRRRPATTADRGFTLVEVLVALAIGTLILAALAVLFSRNSGNQAELERTTRMHENARFALDLLTEDLLHAGYFGEFNPNTMNLPPVYVMPTPCTAGTGTLGWATPAAANPSLPIAVEGIAATAVLGCGAPRQPNTEALAVRHADAAGAVAPGAVVSTNLYVQSSRCLTDVDRVRVGTATTDFNLRRPDCGGVNPRVHRVVQRTYYVARCTDCTGAGDGIPTLRRLEWIEGVLRDTPLAEGIENVQFEFGVDTDNDGWPDVFRTRAAMPAATVPPNAAPADWINVVSVRVHVLARSTQVTPGYADPRTYTMGGVVVTPADGFKRMLLTSTVRLLNVGGRRE